MKPAPWPTTGFVPGAWAEASDGALVLLGTMYSPGHAERLALRNAERVGPESAVPLVLPTSEPAGLQRQPGLFFGSLAPNLDRGVNSIAVGGDGAIWLGGDINSSMDIGSARHGDAYLAKLDGTGRAIREKAYSDGRVLSISSIALRTAGGAVVAGSAFTADTAWLARVGQDGARLQEWRLGNGKGIGSCPCRMAASSSPGSPMAAWQRVPGPTGMRHWRRSRPEPTATMSWHGRWAKPGSRKGRYPSTKGSARMISIAARVVVSAA